MNRLTDRLFLRTRYQAVVADGTTIAGGKHWWCSDFRRRRRCFLLQTPPTRRRWWPQLSRRWFIVDDRPLYWQQYQQGSGKRIGHDLCKPVCVHKDVHYVEKGRADNSDTRRVLHGLVRRTDTHIHALAHTNSRPCQCTDRQVAWIDSVPVITVGMKYSRNYRVDISELARSPTNHADIKGPLSQYW